MREKELEERVLINRDQFLEIEKYIQENYPNVKTIYQKNRYFDDKDGTVKKIHNMLRIRSFRSCKMRELTYKIKGEEGDIEFTQPLSHYWFYQITRYSRLPEGIVKENLISSSKILSFLNNFLIKLFF